MIRTHLSAIALLVSCVLGAQPGPSDSRSTEAALRSMTDAIVRSSTMRLVDRSTGRVAAPAAADTMTGDWAPESPYGDWRYWNGVLNIAMDALGTALHEPSYERFSALNIAFAFDAAPLFERRYAGQDKWSYPFGQFFIMNELDDCGAIGASVIEVFKKDPQERYRVYIEKAAAHILAGQHRLEDGTLVRSFPREWTLWADDLYMGLSFISRYGELTGRVEAFDDAARQVVNFHARLFDEHKGLMAHCWYADEQKRGAAFWGRANGWALLAQVELLDRLPKDHPRRDTLIALFRRHLSGVAQYQSDSGLWHQLIDRPDSYLETSASAMFTYAAARAVRHGYVEPAFAAIAHRGWSGVLSRIRSDGQVEGVCTGTVVSEELSYYYQRPTPLNDAHGIGTVLLAGTEILQQ